MPHKFEATAYGLNNCIAKYIARTSNCTSLMRAFIIGEDHKLVKLVEIT